MSTCCFFGHRDCPSNVKEKIKATIIQLIQEDVTTFYVGNKGNFDHLVKNVLRELSKNFDIRYAIILPYPPTIKQENSVEDYSDTLVPEGVENCPTKFAIDKRNRWLEKQADVVVCYIKHTFGGAYKYVELAGKHKKRIINLADNLT